MTNKIPVEYTLNTNLKLKTQLNFELENNLYSRKESCWGMQP